MFTGIIKEIGTVRGIKKKRALSSMLIEADTLCRSAVQGDSISVDGACLTVSEKSSNIIYFDIMEETLKRTAFDYKKNGDRVNMEPALRLEQGLSGHLVSGHIDETGVIKRIISHGNGTFQFVIGIRKENSPLIVPKGSVAINGISLTIASTGKDYFTVEMIPYTYRMTTMKDRKAGDKVNVEFDMIGKYALRSLKKAERSVIDERFLKERGFL